MRLSALRRSWNNLSREDPFWAILTDADKRGGRWDVNEFFATGVEIVGAELQNVRRFYPALRPGRALDFGCGIGRLTQALAAHFQHVTGVDIADAMLGMARQHNRNGERVQYVHNPHPDLRILGSDRFDFVLSLLTLQHMEPRYTRAYIAEFVRVCAPGGAILFQLPGHGTFVTPPKPEPFRFSWWPPTFWKRLRRAAQERMQRRFGTGPVMEMHGIPQPEVLALLESSGAEVLASYLHDTAGAGIPCYDYLAVKPPRAIAGCRPEPHSKLGPAPEQHHSISESALHPPGKSRLPRSSRDQGRHRSWAGFLCGVGAPGRHKASSALERRRRRAGAGSTPDS